MVKCQHILILAEICLINLILLRHLKITICPWLTLSLKLGSQYGQKTIAANNNPFNGHMGM